MLKALKEWTEWLAMWLCIGFAVAWLVGLFPVARDDSDPPWPEHSGLVPRIDALTGCQYLTTSNGAITPRLDGNGKQVGCKP